MLLFQERMGLNAIQFKIWTTKNFVIYYNWFWGLCFMLEVIGTWCIMTFESGILTSLISAIVSAVTSYIINKYRDIKNTKRNIKEQQLEKLYCPIMKIIDDYYSSYDNEESVGLDEEANFWGKSKWGTTAYSP